MSFSLHWKKRGRQSQDFSSEISQFNVGSSVERGAERLRLVCREERETSRGLVGARMRKENTGSKGKMDRESRTIIEIIIGSF